MLTAILSAAMALQAAPAAPAPLPEPAPLSQDNRALLRCASAFALVARAQTQGDAEAKGWPDLTVRGREFFVRALAQLMDETGRDRVAIAALANAEAQALATSGDVPRIMPSCLLMLEAAKL